VNKNYWVRLLLISFFLASVSLVVITLLTQLEIFNVEGQKPNVAPENITQAIPSQVVNLDNGTTLQLDVSKVIKNTNGSNVIMYALNNQIPGPIIKVK
jgi:hypothetical protein